MFKKLDKLFFFILLGVCVELQAQYTEVINSNRPGFSQSPYSVGTGVYQFETSFFYKKSEIIPTFSNPEAFGANLFFRTSFLLQKLELNLNTSFQKDKIAFKNIFESSYTESGFSKLTLGAKYLLFQPTYTDKSKEIRSWKRKMAFDWKRLIPSVAVYGGVNFGSVLTDYHNRGGITPKVGALLQNEFSYKFNLISNFYYDYIISDFAQFSCVITATYNFNDFWSGFAEYQGFFNGSKDDNNLGIGVTYLFSNDLQFNLSGRSALTNNASNYYGSLGVSFRLDKHKDKYIEVDNFGNEIKREAPASSKNRGIFGRLFGKKDSGNTSSSKRKRKKAVTKVEKEKGFFGRLFGKKNKN
ncbi:transporter [Tenacibaculum sp. UWU-22]|uniref:transporter n=1 Tax=Tenacibaculum sp. UWU-22 TaxID=3234187 RepID=UPI0034DB3C81